MFSVCLTPQPPPDPLGFILSTTTNQITSIMVSDSEQTPVAHMQRFAIGPFLSFLVFEGIWSIRITPSRHQPTSTPLDPSSPIIFISFLRPLSYRVLGMFSLATLFPLFLIPLPKLTVYQKPSFIYPPLVVPFSSVIFPPLSCFGMRTGLLSSHTSFSSFLSPGLFLPLFRLSSPFLRWTLSAACVSIFPVLFSNFPNFAHLHYFAIETIFPPKRVVPTD